MALPLNFFHSTLIVPITLFSLLLLLPASSALHKTYIVHVKKMNPSSAGVAETEDIIRSYHKSFLPTGAKDSLIHSYKHVVSGFSARLTREQVELIKDTEGFISILPDGASQPHTTRSPGFLGLNQNSGAWPQTGLGKGVIVGLLDTGITPGHPSFCDAGMPPPRATWKGQCDLPHKLKSRCNNKLIGARVFQAGNASASPVDTRGHGTHTASTAVGAFVPSVSIQGVAAGTASGVAPHAHLATYKVCFDVCTDSDVLAGIDAAIEDGVDVLSASLAFWPRPYYEDSVMKGGFEAAKKGILMVVSAGNYGPAPWIVVNDAPWLLTVGSSTIDRRIRALAKLGNGMTFDGESVFQPKNFSSQKLWPLVYYTSSGGRQQCYNGSLAGFDVRNKIVLCDIDVVIYTPNLVTALIDPVNQAREVKDAGGAAMILANDELAAFSHYTEFLDLPSTTVSFIAGQKIKAYIKATSSPKATILFEGTELGYPISPTISYFSSRGPSNEAPGVLKPDIVAPGEMILAGWSPLDPDNFGNIFKIDSGTSMACPHISGVVALLKSAHPDWSPAALKSAIMTTADLVNAHGIPILDEKLTPANIYAAGAGHVNPNRALDPGLVYDIAMDEYVPFLCGLGYTEDQVEMITQEPADCSYKIPQWQLNYPTFSVSLGPLQTFSRTVTNVGEPVSCYSVRISEPPGVNIVVRPSRMCFTRLKQKATYHVMFHRSKNMIDCGNNESVAQGFLLWESGKYTVRSVIAINITGQHF
ncbi:Subtilisin-like protease SBT1.2 [Striga hermonthica]|uniref:Subtilisin-like protease SBT1.2 n=1 Tax=Striga hermonthica TaxID=68872 RepID=A0A9N7RR08_STRHE|nr:Subtilisin-like protease SBT1.2 [Striga hermonthica]